MSVSVTVRGVRAAVFAAMCVLLAVGGHGLAMGELPPLWADGIGFLGIFVLGFLLGGRERSLAGIGSATLAAQAGLHFAYEATRPRTAMAMHGMRMAHAHAVTPHAVAAHTAAALVASWWLRRGEAAVWSLLRRAVTLVPGLAAWWRAGTDVLPAPARRGPIRGSGAGPQALRQVLLRYAVSRRGPPAALSYTR
ncbi:hypothetical protein [Streptomyces sp. NBC_01431]|uniref:hypothetical protein n=1 Tax=Streptomyces sp. NBC_01431 TaxID=2903863 RepID=UPI002E318738|nr:hypothetical protein [Streptomyces sp. NBC_01431]